jgi:filamentous hemagglutinin family protein
MLLRGFHVMPSMISPSKAQRTKRVGEPSVDAQPLVDFARRLHASFAAMTAIAAALALPRFALANPTGGVVVGGAATISSTGSVTNVVQSTNRAIINWQTFSIATGETVNFLQPSALSVTLNRVIGNEQSIIAGALNANGRVFLVNSAGVLFTKDAQVNVGGLVASTLDISNSNFMAGNYTFSGSSSASVVNRGTLNAADGGHVVLLGKTVSNEGVINARLGSIALASGEQITLNFGGDSFLDVTIDKGTYGALVENKGLIRADGGQVMMSARAADAVLSAQVNNSGIVQARTIADLAGGSSASGTVKIGKIKLLASGGTTKVSGTLDASAPSGGKGGAVETSGNKVTIAEGAAITTASSTGETGTWIIDPDGFTIGPNGGDITGTLLGSLLASNNIALWSTNGNGTDGNINVNSAVSWSGNTILTLNATNNININAPSTATGASAGLVLNYGGYAATGSATLGTNYNIDTAKGASVTLRGASASLNINGNAYTLIRSMSDLVAINNGSGYYALVQDLNASGTTYTGPVISTLNGTLAGLGHTISNLTIANSGSGRAALVGTLGSSTATTATVRDIGLPNVDVTTTQSYAAALVGLNWGVVSNAYATGKVSGVATVGGLVARNQFGSITNSWANVNVFGTNEVGGLVGLNIGSSSTSAATGFTTYRGVISNSYATGAVSDIAATSIRNNFGGLVGRNSGGEIIGSYATGEIKLTNANTSSGDLGNVGGLVGINTTNAGSVGLIANSYASGNVTSPGNFVGGLVGYNYGGNIDSSHASGNVSGGDDVGGVAGANDVNGSLGGSITNSYATGNVNGHDQVGGIAGRSQGSVSNSNYSIGAVTGNNQVGGGVGANSGAISNVTVSGNVTGVDFH